MRIALFHNLPSGGAKRFVYEEVRELLRRGHHVDEYTTTLADLRSFDLAPHVRAQRVFDAPLSGFSTRDIPLVMPYVHNAQLYRLLRRTQQLQQSIAREIDAGNYDVVLAADCQIMPTPYLLRYLRTPSASQIHDLRRRDGAWQAADEAGSTAFAEKLKRTYYAPARGLARRLRAVDEARNMRVANLVLTNSEFCRSLLRERYGIAAQVMYPGIDTALFHPAGATKEDFVLAVGALHYWKGYRFLVTALGLLPAPRRPRLLIAANSAEPAEQALVEEMAARMGVTLCIENVRDDRRMVHLYNAARAFVYAPLEEALGLAPLEAMACGLPSVAVGEGGVRETVVDGVTGWLVPRDARLFADRLDALLQDDVQRDLLGEQGVNYVRENWNWGRAVDRLEAYLTQVATQARR